MILNAAVLCSFVVSKQGGWGEVMEEERTTALVVKARNEEKRRNFKPLDFFLKSHFDFCFPRDQSLAV